MAKSSGLTDIGNLLAVIGGVLMVIFGILAIVADVAGSINASLDNLGQYNYQLVNYGGGLVHGIVTLVIGIVLIYIYKEKKGGRSGDDLLIYGIIYIVLGFIGGSLGGLLAIIGGILLIIDFFL